MEDLPRNLGKAVNKVKLPRPTRRAKAWTLLFVGGSGKVIPIKWFKGYLIALGLLFVVSLAADIALIFYYQKVSHRSDSLKAKISQQQDRLSDLRIERDQLMVKLAVAQNSLVEKKKEDIPHKTETVLEEPALIVEQQTEIGQDQKNEKRLPPENEQIDSTYARTSENTNEVPTTSAAKSNHQGEETVGRMGDVAVEEFNVAYNAVSGVLAVNFNIKNNSGDRSKPLSGRTYVVLKDESALPNKWLVTPRVQLVSGKPANGSRGQYFSILFFKPVTIELKGIENPQIYTKAVVYIYASEKDLMLEKEFPVRLDGKLPDE